MTTPKTKALPRARCRICRKLALHPPGATWWDIVPYACREHMPIRELAREVVTGRRGDWLADVMPVGMPLHYWLMNNSNAHPICPVSWQDELLVILNKLDVELEEEEESR